MGLAVDKAYLIAIWLESLLYGFYVCLFLTSVYVNYTLRRSQNVHSRVIFLVGPVFFTLATLHLCVDAYRLYQAFIVHDRDPGGANAFLADLRKWHHILKDALYGFQEVIGDFVALYRCWIIWDKNWKVVFIPFLLSIGCTATGFALITSYSNANSNLMDIFDPYFSRMVYPFFTITLFQSTVTTGLTAYRLWTINRQSSQYRSGPGVLIPILLIVVESTALLAFTEIILLVLYTMKDFAIAICLDSITPLVGITFSTITMRIAMQLSNFHDRDIEGCTSVLFTTANPTAEAVFSGGEECVKESDSEFSDWTITSSTGSVTSSGTLSGPATSSVRSSPRLPSSSLSR